MIAPAPEDILFFLGDALYAVDREQFYQALEPADMRSVYRQRRREKMARENWEKEDKNAAA